MESGLAWQNVYDYPHKFSCPQAKNCKWFCAVKINGGVVARTTNLEDAQSHLGQGNKNNRQAIIPMTGGTAGDPHTLPKGWGTGSMWWWAWPDINQMREKCAGQQPVCKGATVRKITSTHSNWYNDRRWLWTCSEDAMLSTSSCYWTEWTAYDVEFTRQCNNGYTITGTESNHSNWSEDRQFRYKCCKIGDHCEKGTCIDTDFLNEYNLDINFDVPSTFQLVALYSIHHNWWQDRRFKAKICKYTCSAPSYSIYKVEWNTTGINFVLPPQSLSSQTVTNNSPASITTTVTFEESKAIEESTFWDTSFESNVTFSDSIGWSVASQSADVTLSYGMSKGQASTVTTQKTFSKSFQVEVPAYASVEVNLVAKKQDDIAIPFTATLERTFKGETTQVTTTGTWRGTLYSTDTVEVKELKLQN